jgi:type IV pilus assembly protein PilC
MAQDKKVRLESSELAWLCEQIALIQKSGIPLPEGIDLLAESADLPRQSSVLNGLAGEMRKMVPLSDAMETLDSFPPYLVRMAKVGEMSGNLDHVMSNLAEFYTRDAELRKRLRSALIYPVVLLLMMLAIIVLLVVRVLPVFSEILTSFGGTMPAFSQGLLSFGNFIAASAFWLLPLLVVVIVALTLWLRRSTSGRRLVDRARLRLPILGPLYQRIYTSRFSIVLSYMLRSGVDLDTALSMSEAVMDNSLVSERISECRKKIRKGTDTFQALQETDLFPKLFVRMLSLGSRTGEMDAVMHKIALAYESEVNSRLARLTGIVEPLLVVILSVIVGGILLTVMLPLVEIMSSIG